MSRDEYYQQLAETYKTLRDEGMSDAQAAALVDGIMREDIKAQKRHVAAGNTDEGSKK